MNKRLVEIAREHVHLAAVFGRKDTTREEKESIRARIAELRAERDRLLEAIKEKYGRISYTG